jgi:hypothetical protein
MQLDITAMAILFVTYPLRPKLLQGQQGICQIWTVNDIQEQRETLDLLTFIWQRSALQVRHGDMAT